MVPLPSDSSTATKLTLFRLVTQLFQRKYESSLCVPVKREILCLVFCVEPLRFTFGLFKILCGVKPDSTTTRFICENIKHFGPAFWNQVQFTGTAQMWCEL